MAVEKSMDKEVFESAPVPSAVRSFVIPSLISTLITIIYSMADTFFVGMLADPKQMAALTVVFPFYNMMPAFANLWGVGGNAVMSVSLGEKDYDRASKVSLYAFWGCAGFMVLVCCGWMVFRNALLAFGGGGPDTMDYARDYMQVAFVMGSLPTVLSIVMANLLRAEGHAKRASYGLMLGGILNCFLDPLFIFGFDQGILGAAIATALSNVVSLIYFFVVYARMAKTSYIRLRPYAHTFDGAALRKMILCGLPSFILPILGATGTMVQNSLYAKYGTAALAGWGVALRVSFIGVNSAHGTAQGVLPLVGYNYGAKNFDRMRACTYEAVKYLIVITLVLLAVCEVFPSQVIRAFINDDPSVEAGALILRIYMICIPFMCVILFVSTLCQAIGRWQYAMGLLVLRQLAVNIPVTIALEHLFQLPGIPAGQPTCDIICFFLAVFVYRHCFVTLMRRMEERGEK